MKNLRSHLFTNCEAAAIYEHRARIKQGGYEACFNDYQDWMVATRIGKNGSVRQSAGYKTDPNDTRSRFVSWAIFETVWGTTLNRQTGEEEKLTVRRMSMHRVCVYHVGQEYISQAAALCGEIIAIMCSECAYCQVDVMAGGGNKAAYLCTPKNPGCPTYEVSLLQFWINRVIHTVTQSRLKNYGLSPPIKAKHFISRSCNDLAHLNHHLRGIKVYTYTGELAQKTDGYGDCCMLTLLE